MRLIFTFLLLISILFVRAQDVAVLPISTAQGIMPASGMVATELSVGKVYPNPVKDKVTLELQTSRSGDVQLSLINILGSIVKQWSPAYLSSGSQKIVLDLSAFQPGIYFLRLTKSNQVVTQILKKN
jgi:hypothetical protein